MVLSFPLVGEDHPLRRHAMGILFKSALLSMMLHGLFAGGRLFIANRFPAVEFEDRTYVRPFIVDNPPEIEEPKVPVPVKPVPLPSVNPDGIPDPVSFVDPQIETDPAAFPGASDNMEPYDGEDVGRDPGSPVWGGADSSIVYDDSFPASDPPQAIHIPIPEYPESARDAGVEGDVVLRIKVGTSGRVEEIQVLRGVPMLNDAAVEAAARAVFRPAQHKGRLVACWVVLPVRFTLK